MKNLAMILVAVILLTSCSSTKKTSSSSSSTVSATSSSSVNDGSSYEKAIYIKEKSESSGVTAEYKWLEKNYPGYSLIKQSLEHKENKYYDVMHIKTKAKEEKYVYFDITGFFGKL